MMTLRGEGVEQAASMIRLSFVNLTREIVVGS